MIEDDACFSIRFTDVEYSSQFLFVITCLSEQGCFSQSSPMRKLSLFDFSRYGCIGTPGESETSGNFKFVYQLLPVLCIQSSEASERGSTSPSSARSHFPDAHGPSQMIMKADVSLRQLENGPPAMLLDGRAYGDEPIE